MLKHYIITDGSKRDTIDALYLLFKQGSDEYQISFQSLPYSRGGKYARHTSTLYSVQKWEIIEMSDGFYIYKSSTSKSASCPDVIVPKFYTETGKAFHNAKIQEQIDKLKKQLLK